METVVVGLEKLPTPAEFSAATLNECSPDKPSMATRYVDPFVVTQPNHVRPESPDSCTT